MLKKTIHRPRAPVACAFGITVATPLRAVSAQPASQTAHSAVATDAPTGTFQRDRGNGSVTMDLDLTD